MNMQMQAVVAALSMTVLSAQASAVPTVEDVRLEATGSRLIVTYGLTGAPAYVTCEFLTNATASSEGGALDPGLTWNVTGDCNGLVPVGKRRLTWPFSKAGVARESLQNVRARLTAWRTWTPPPYMAVDLRASAQSDRKRRFYASAADVPGGVTDNRYKTDFLLMRRVQAEGVVWRMGLTRDVWSWWPACTPHLVRLSRDYYIAVYETTVGQFAAMSQSAVPADANPRHPAICSYDRLRGENCGYPTVADVAAGSRISKFREVTGLASLDLPTDAQWEFACRAGCGGDFHWGNDSTDSIINLYANYVGNAIREVGTLKPNAWGLYDMAGNAGEWTLDWHASGDAYLAEFASELASGRAIADPRGPTTGTDRVVRGGWCGSVDKERLLSGYRNYYPPASEYAHHFGFRLCCPADSL